MPDGHSAPTVLDMIPLLMAFRGLTRAVGAVWRDPETKALPVVAGVLVVTGTLFYWRFEEGWSLIDALYFSIVTLTTVGYGDLHPTSDGTQIFTIIYILTGLGILVSLLGAVAEQYVAQKAERVKLRERVKARKKGSAEEQPS
jgi:voltage-gated potassium channel